MKRFLILPVILFMLLIVFCGGRKATFSTSEEIGTIDVSHVGEPLTEIQTKLSRGYAHLQKKEYDEGMELIKEAYEMIDVANKVDLPLVNSRIHLYRSLIFAENDLLAQARDQLGTAQQNASQAVSGITDENQKTKADELLTCYDELGELLLEKTNDETIQKYTDAFKLLEELIMMRAGKTIEETEETE
jgi:tetratricopeptide (TPR) repeat protein